jgi:hypothetical protein
MDMAAGVSNLYAVIQDGRAHVIQVDFKQMALLTLISEGQLRAALTSKGQLRAALTSEGQLRVALQSKAITILKIT